jgi:signal transduction histidine kinase
MTVSGASFEDERGGNVIRLVDRATADAQVDVAAHLALEAAGLGAWEIVPVTGESRWSTRAKVLLGFRADEQITYEQFLRAMRPADRLRCIEAFLRVIEPHGDAEFRVEVCVAKGRSRWLALAGATYIDHRAAVRLVGTIHEVTAEKLQQIRLAELRHDLRGPLQGIVIGAELARKSQAPKAAELLSRIGAMATRADRMLDGLVEGPRSGGAREPRPAPMALSDVCAEVIEEMLLAHGDREIRLHASSPCRGEWDRDSLFRLVRNLVCNAVQHGDPAAPVDVTLAEAGRCAALSVASRGRPIPSSVRQRFRDPLRSERWQRDGHGLGLHIVHEIALEHGGSSELISDETGTVVRVKLPKRRPARRRGRGAPPS